MTLARAQLEVLRETLRAMAPASGVMKPSRLVERASRCSGLQRLEVRDGLEELARLGELEGQLDNGVPRTQIRLRFPAATMTADERAWRTTLEELDEADREALAPLHASLAGWSDPDRGRLRDGLLRLRAAQDKLRGLSRYVVSARYLLGSSKLLDKLPRSALRRFGLADHLFSGNSPNLLIAGPNRPETVVLVENPTAFEFAVQATSDLPVVWVATYGYGLSMASEDYGRNLTFAIEVDDFATVVRSGQPPTPRRAFACEHLAFWGDLDPEGFRIYRRLRNRLPHLRLSALYEPMLELLEAAGGHPLDEATGKAGQKAGAEHHLAEHCATRGIDQEAVCEPELLRRYSVALLQEP